jgi:predicted nucleic acid-binding protein
VKLLVDEPESEALKHALGEPVSLATSRLALVEVPRATALADPSADMLKETNRLLESCLLLDVDTNVLAQARLLTTRRIRALDAIHLATALYMEAQTLLSYDRRMLEGAAGLGLAVSHPGLWL